MKVLITLLVLAALVSAGHVESGKAKADALRRLAAESPDGMIRFNSTGYRYFLTETPRPYEVVLYLTAPKCEFCDEMQGQYEQASQIYAKNGGLESFQEGSKKLRAVFFAVMVFEQATREVFLDLELKAVPNILVSVPKHALVSDTERPTFLKGFKWQISGSDGLVTFHKVLEYVNKRTGRNFEYKAPLSEIIRGLGILLAFVVGGIMMFRMFKPFFLNTKLWFAGSILIYFVCIAGVVYNQIHDVPMTTMNKKGELEWMLKDQRSQLGAEGFVMSGLFVFVALTMIAWHFLAMIGTQKLFGKLLFIAFFGITLIAVLQVEDLYKFKGWYTIQFFPPSEYNRGPLMKDQGNSI